MPDGHVSNEPPPETGRSFAFPLPTRLKRRRLIRPLFNRSRDDVGTVAIGCIRLLYRVVPRTETGYEVPVQVGFAPGRIRTAVRRNRIRRLLREGYRVRQHMLADLFVQHPGTLTLMVLFRGHPEQAVACIPRDLPNALEQLAMRLTDAWPPPIS